MGDEYTETIKNEGLMVRTRGWCLAGSDCLLYYYELPL